MAPNVVSPKAHWTLITVLDDGGPGEVAIAVGRWDGEPVVAMRWNGTDDSPVGNPQSRGLPTWFILPNGKYAEAVLNALPTEKQALARHFMPESAA